VQRSFYLRFWQEGIEHFLLQNSQGTNSAFNQMFLLKTLKNDPGSKDICLKKALIAADFRAMLQNSIIML
jgi:hypothetical protein